MNYIVTLVCLSIAAGFAAAGHAWPAGIFAFYAGTHRRPYVPQEE
ncbi:hypothetical protein LCGC14_2337120 [marine sediment metagenome]|uniref:Uncharacterized protein n=1 Tax=marine sediment metagenome TaxID=412755 RepID=A0A0F9EQZ7_9ZZZZ